MGILPPRTYLLVFLRLAPQVELLLLELPCHGEQITCKLRTRAHHELSTYKQLYVSTHVCIGCLQDNTWSCSSSCESILPVDVAGSTTTPGRLLLLRTLPADLAAPSTHRSAFL